MGNKGPGNPSSNKIINKDKQNVAPGKQTGHSGISVLFALVIMTTLL